MAERAEPNVYSIAAHRGFADALVAGLTPRYRDEEFGLAKLTLLLPSGRAQRIVTEAFIRHAGEEGHQGLLMPRMALVGDLDLDETLGSLLDPLGSPDIPRAIPPLRRWLALAKLIGEEMGEDAPKGATLLRLARETGATMDRLLVEGVGPEELLDEKVTALVGDLSDHWRRSLHLFAKVQRRWLATLQQWGAVDSATRRNLLFEHASRRWKAQPPHTPIVAAGVTSASPALAGLLRTIADLPQGAVILPDLDLSMSPEVWGELGRAGAAPEPGDEPFARDDAITHPQYHLKLLLNRMGVARDEVQQWHRKGMSAAPPERTHAISALFLPPDASRSWVDLPSEKRRLSGVNTVQSARPEEEAQAIALLVRRALEEEGKRVAVVTPDRGLARRVVQHLKRWEIDADDTAGRPLSDTPAGRLFLLLAQVMGAGASPVSMMALASHPLVDGGMDRGEWLRATRYFERKSRGPRPREGLEPFDELAEELAKERPPVAVWWRRFRALVSPLIERPERLALADALDRLAEASEGFAGERIWAREDGRALSRFVEELRMEARGAGTELASPDADAVLHEAMEQVAVRPPYGGHPRVAIYGLLESRMSRADLVICAGLNEGVWPPRGGVDALLAPPVLRALGVPGADFRIGLAAHDLAGALGAPEVVLSRSARDESGPAIPSRFLLRVQALLGELLLRHEDRETIQLARALSLPREESGRYPRPKLMPTAEQRRVDISATALDRLLGDPYQFFAGKIMQLNGLDALDADPTPAWQGEVAHEILEQWHRARKNGTETGIVETMEAVFAKRNVHPLLRGLWQPRLQAALEWVANEIDGYEDREVLCVEAWGEMRVEGVRIHGKIDRLDRLPDGSLAIIDYKTGSPPSAGMVEKGFALQLGLLGMMAQRGGFKGVTGEPSCFEYWSLGKAKSDTNPFAFGYVETPLKIGNKRTGLAPEDFLPRTAEFLDAAIARWIVGDEPFIARHNPDYPAYDTYDQLMRLQEWLPHMDAEEDAQ